MQEHEETIGALARIRRADVLKALGASKSGQVISLNLPLDDPNVPFGRLAFRRTMRVHNDVRPLGDGRYIIINDDQVEVALQGSSQWDSFAHFGVIDESTEAQGVYFGGYGLEETYRTSVAEHAGIQSIGPGIVARGVLIDLVAAVGAGEPFLDEQRIGRKAVEDALAQQRNTLEPGDAVLLYTGFERRRAALGGVFPERTAGIDGTTIDLWDEARIVALISDNPAVEALPTDYAIHIGMLRGLGTPLGELWALEDLAQACREDGRYDFLLVSVPLNIRGAFGSTANAIAIR